MKKNLLLLLFFVFWFICTTVREIIISFFGVICSFRVQVSANNKKNSKKNLFLQAFKNFALLTWKPTITCPRKCQTEIHNSIDVDKQQDSYKNDVCQCLCFPFPKIILVDSTSMVNHIEFLVFRQFHNNLNVLLLRTETRTSDALLR